MAHRSDSHYSLNILNMDNIENADNNDGIVHVIHIPTKYDNSYKLNYNFFLEYIYNFVSSIHENSVVCFLCNTLCALDLISLANKHLNYRIWISIEREKPKKTKFSFQDNHTELVIFTKHNLNFKHTKIQIKYTICPACGKTTKDYGGKKHTYSPYGTLMSDVWRDIKYCEDKHPDNILNRLSDMFAIEPYHSLYYYDLRYLDSIITKNQSIEPKYSIVYKNKIESTLINDDCLKTLSSFPSNSVDFVFADPPYNIKKKYHNWDDSIQIEDYFSWCDEWIKLIYNILKPGKIFCLLNIPLWIVRHYIFSKQYFNYFDYITWEALGLPVRNIMPAHYGILCLSKGEPQKIINIENTYSNETINYSSMTIKEWYCSRQSCVKSRNYIKNTDREPITNLWWDIHRLKHNSKRVDHPTQLPPPFMKRLIYTFTDPDDLVLDPFNGAGTTSLTADLMKRKYVGIELSEKYHKIATERHKEIKSGLDPFRKKNTTPKAKNSRVERLKKQKYEISKKTLQLEVREIADKLGRKPTKDDIKSHSSYPFHFFEDYFIDWGEVCAAVGDKGMNESPDATDMNKLQFRQLSLTDLK